MKVKLKEKIIGLTFQKVYFVYEIYIKENNRKLIVLENDDKQLIKYELDKFEIVELDEPEDWMNIKKNDGELIKTFPEFMEDGYWEKFYNDDFDSVKSFHDVKLKVYGTLLDDEECIIKINSKDIGEQILILEALLKVNNGNFVDHVILIAKEKLNSNSSNMEPLLLEYAFTYLKKFTCNQVEQFFLEYYKNIELGTKKLTSIVNSYFEEYN